MIDERTEELATAYAIGALDAEEAAEFERQLAGDAELRALVAQLRGVSSLLAGNMPALEPSAALRARLLMDIPERTPARAAARRGYQTWLPWALAAGFALLCLLFGWQANGLRVQLDAQQRRTDELNVLANTLRSDRDDLRQTVATLQQSNQLANVRIALLSSQLRTDPKAVAVSVWDNERQRGVMVLHHLKPAPTGKDYQLWIIDPDYPSPVSAGILHVDQDGNGRVDFKATQRIDKPNQFAVTEEVKGGSPVPTLKAMVLAGA